MCGNILNNYAKRNASQPFVQSQGPIAAIICHYVHLSNYECDDTEEIAFFLY